MLDGADGLNDLRRRYSGVMPAAPSWNAALQSTITGRRKRPVAVGQAFAGQHQVWEIMPHEPGHSTAGSTRVCVKPEETGPKRPE